MGGFAGAGKDAMSGRGGAARWGRCGDSMSDRGCAMGAARAQAYGPLIAGVWRRASCRAWTFSRAVRTARGQPPSSPPLGSLGRARPSGGLGGDWRCRPVGRQIVAGGCGCGGLSSSLMGIEVACGAGLVRCCRADWPGAVSAVSAASNSVSVSGSVSVSDSVSVSVSGSVSGSARSRSRSRSRTRSRTRVRARDRGRTRSQGRGRGRGRGRVEGVGG